MQACDTILTGNDNDAPPPSGRVASHSCTQCSVPDPPSLPGLTMVNDARVDLGGWFGVSTLKYLVSTAKVALHNGTMAAMLTGFIFMAYE